MLIILEPGSRIKAKRKRYKFESDTETSNMFLQFQEQEINSKFYNILYLYINYIYGDGIKILFIY